MPYTEAAKRATMKYQAENYNHLSIRFKKDVYEAMEDHISYTGESKVKFISRAILETIERDRQAIAQKNKAERKAKQE